MNFKNIPTDILRENINNILNNEIKNNIKDNISKNNNVFYEYSTQYNVKFIISNKNLYFFLG